MGNMENVWYVRIAPVGIKRQFQGSQMQDVQYVIRKWKWSEKVKDRSLYAFADIRKNCLHLNREKQGSGMSKKEVNRYLKKQQKEAEQPINNAFAEAFAKIKL